MRPSRVDTSDPACTKRKMLSTNSSTSWLLLVAEVLGDRERRQGDPKAHPRRLVHLAEHEGGLVEDGGLVVDAGLAHLDEQVGALTGPLADAGEHRHATELAGDAVDHLGDEHGLADPGAAEQADLAALEVRREQVDDLDAGLEHFLLRLERVEVGRIAVDARRSALDVVELGNVEGLAQHVEHVAEHAVAHRHLQRVAGVAHLGVAHADRRWA